VTTRRDFVIALGACAFTRDLRAQERGKMWRVGFLAPRRPASIESDPYGAFAAGMRELGYVEGRNLVIEWRFADGNFERLAELAAELVRLNVDVIGSVGPQATSAAQKATRTIPIVMLTVSVDPVRAGFIKSFARPEGNITGFANLTGDISPKLLEMLLAIAPRLSRVGLLLNPTNAGHAGVLKDIQSAAQTVGVKIVPAQARTPQEIAAALSKIARENTSALIIALDGIFVQQRRQIAELAAKNRLASIATFSEYVQDGGLLSYGPNLADQYRRGAGYVVKILKGAKPGDLPVEQATKFELVINRNTAKALGLAIPQTLLISADKVLG
jgi:putative ABC transport system substrate-binding protein